MLSRSEIYEIVNNLHDRLPLSGVVYVKERNNIMFESGYGFANRADDIRNNVDTRFSIATGSKLFTAIAICQLVERGLFHFQTRLKDCLNFTFPNFDENITIHHLLTHTSGIHDYFDEDTMEDFEELWEERPMYNFKTLKDFLPLFQKNYMRCKPGERFHYNNAGYILLGLIIEEQTGLSFTDYIEKNIFKKCRMNSSGYFFLNQLPTNTAIGYIYDEKSASWRTNIYSIPIRGGADSGVFITAPDMVKFWEYLFKYKLLSKEFTKKLLTAYVQLNENEYYGYGLWITKIFNSIFNYHVKGHAPGISFHSAVYPALGLKIVVTSNQQEGPQLVIQEIEDSLIEPPKFPTI
ncbi:CubicO group peptidase (beta-lactamase class C family) [Evansella vedderi]|uniref:CubicO group peptidase (Beta-lactamase class C family) n=1 Tax=Evansella vedderi TaxID=38282 RepID=A0ABT9ZV77_9BACI|nr:serine hydrolase [Evansella vedderi]MDQ0254035.1 CubicO group peptidase (beta-lactamase class C family) [Evansella vedderi]